MNCCSEFQVPKASLKQQRQQARDKASLDQADSSLLTKAAHDKLWRNIPRVSSTFEAAHRCLKKPLVDYLSAYRHYHLCVSLSRTFPILFPDLQSHVVPAADPLPYESNSQAQPLSFQGPSPTMTITMFARNEIERTMLLHRPELVRTLSLPIQRLLAFLSIGPKLTSLERFELYGVSWHYDLDPAIAFLKEHSRLFGTIREFKIAGPNDVRALRKPRLHRILNAIKHPKVIDLSRYREATRDLNSFEIQNAHGLEQLLFDLDFGAGSGPTAVHAAAIEAADSIPSSSPVKARGAFTLVQNGLSVKDPALGLIQQCANLSTLQLGVQTSTAFSWAVDRYNLDPLSLQQLKLLHLSSPRTATIKQVLDDCLYAFRDSLEDVKGIALKLSPVPSPIPFGWTWPLQRLSVLSLQGELAVWFDLESLRFCPKLTELCLVLYPYSPPEANHLDKLVLAPGLTTLSLMGRWIVTDTTMKHIGEKLHKLKRLVLEGCQADTLTGEGTVAGLDKMPALSKVEIALGAGIEAALKAYRLNRPGLEIAMRSDDSLRLE
ncbi:hypothetical protein BGZ70_008202 [Mortierella alpina]|uniref:Uncharacterized protein n=1 Tax=Mortierella alpina TaxID=64518 RepID=A0A9P6J792_MORAP|nr:hypothetical protein BGZ70_008202 [Mortierella alpina]